VKQPWKRTMWSYFFHHATQCTAAARTYWWFHCEVIAKTFAAGVRDLVLWNHALSRYFRATLQLHNSPTDCARELFKCSKDAVSLLIALKKFGKFWISVFLGWRHKWGRFWAILALVTWCWTPTARGNFWPKFYWKLGYNQRLLSVWLTF